MYSMPDFTMLALHSPSFTCEAKMLPKVESSWPGTTMGRLGLRRREQPAVAPGRPGAARGPMAWTSS